MIASLSALLLGAATLTSALPLMEVRAVASLNQEATREAHQRDNGATRAFSDIEIKTANGQCLFVNELSGDFRANLNAIEVGNCNGNRQQKWDVLTAGKHNNRAGSALIVSTNTQACMNFDDRRAAGNTVIMFSCGGRADGSGEVNDSQLFAFNGGNGATALGPKNAPGVCFTVRGAVLDQAPCNPNDANQRFTFGNGNGGSNNATPPAPAPPAPAPPAPAPPAPAPPAPVSPAPPANGIPSVNPTTPVPVLRAGGVLNIADTREAHVRDNGATRAFSSVSIRNSNGQCLFINPVAGDFRQNLIPIELKACTGSPNEKFDVITAGLHNDQPNSALIVSALTQGCLNFDSRRAAGDQVLLFSCGGRAAGEGRVTDSQLFKFTGGNTLSLAPNNERGAICFVPRGGVLDAAGCNANDASQTFTIVA